MLQKNQLNISYIYNRLSQIIFQKLYPNAPWLTKLSIRLLVDLIMESDIGLEFGSGRSTLWFAKKCKHLTSIENNPYWYKKISAKLNNYNNIEYYLKNLKESAKNSEYYNSIHAFKDDHFDFILIDGKYRDLLALESINKLKKGGLLILDNAERYLPNDFKTPSSIGRNNNKVNGNWREFYKKTTTWRRIWTSNGVSTTLILFKPA